jgi:hypothetical protein
VQIDLLVRLVQVRLLGPLKVLAVESDGSPRRSAMRVLEVLEFLLS